MSIAATVRRTPRGISDDQPAQDYLPVATEAEFAQYWQPLAEAGDFSTVAGFRLGVSLAPADLPALVQELDGFSSALKTAGYSAEISVRMRDRVTRLRDFLTAANAADVEEIFLG